MGKSLKSLVVASAMAAALGAANLAQAAIIFDVRVSSVTGPGVEKLDDKNVRVITVGGTVNFDVYAVITGANGTGADDGFQTARGYILAPTGGGATGHLGGGALVSPFNGNSAVAGSNTDQNADTYLDLGSTASSATNSILPRSNSMTLGNEHRFYSFSLTISSLGTELGSSISFNRVGTATTIAWQEDGVAKNTTAGTVGTAIPVNFVGIPEPASLGLMAFGGLALLARRRK